MVYQIYELFTIEETVYLQIKLSVDGIFKYQQI